VLEFDELGAVRILWVSDDDGIPKPGARFSNRIALVQRELDRRLTPPTPELPDETLHLPQDVQVAYHLAIRQIQ